MSIRIEGTPLSVTRPFPGRVETVIAAAAIAGLVALLRSGTAVLLPSEAAFALPGDHHIYRFMAQESLGAFHVAPWCWRPLVPWLANAMPGSAALGFQLVAGLALWLTAVLVFVLGRVLGGDVRAAAVGAALFLSLGYATKFNLYDVWLTDPVAFLFTMLALLCVVLRWDIGFALCLLLGVLAKESVLFAAALYYGLRAERALDARTAGRLAALSAPAILAVLGLRLAIPAANGDPSYLASLPNPIRLNARTVPSYDVPAIVGRVLSERDWLATTWRTLSAFGIVPAVLALAGAVTNPRLAVRLAPFMVLVLGQLLFAFQTQRLVVLAFPAILLLALVGVARLRRRISFGPVAVLASGTFLLALAHPTEWEPPVVAQLAVVALAAAVLVATGPRGITEQIRATSTRGSPPRRGRERHAS